MNKLLSEASMPRIVKSANNFREHGMGMPFNGFPANSKSLRAQEKNLPKGYS